MPICSPRKRNSCRLQLALAHHRVGEPELAAEAFAEVDAANLGAADQLLVAAWFARLAAAEPDLPQQLEYQQSMLDALARA